MIPRILHHSRRLGVILLSRLASAADTVALITARCNRSDSVLNCVTVRFTIATLRVLPELFLLPFHLLNGLSLLQLLLHDKLVAHQALQLLLVLLDVAEHLLDGLALLLLCSSFLEPVGRSTPILIFLHRRPI